MTRRTFDATGGAYYGEVVRQAVAGDCLICNRPRTLDHARGGCGCVLTDPREDREALARAILRGLRARAAELRARRAARVDDVLAFLAWLAFLAVLFSGAWLLIE